MTSNIIDLNKIKYSKVASINPNFNLNPGIIHHIPVNKKKINNTCIPATGAGSNLNFLQQGKSVTTSENIIDRCLYNNPFLLNHSLRFHKYPTLTALI